MAELTLQILRDAVAGAAAAFILRDSELDGQPFRRSPRGKALDTVSPTNATALFELCPTALLFGMWDSHGPKGGLGPKFERAMVSEIVGVGAEWGRPGRPGGGGGT